MTGIYQITSKSYSCRVYIGSAIDLYKRWSLHKTNLRNNKHHSIKLQNHVNKYGINDLYFFIIEQCDSAVLKEREQYYIDNIKPWFNIATDVERPMLGRKQSDETKKKISESHIGIRPNEETRKKLSDAQLGNKKALGVIQSEESKNKNRLAHIGRRWTEEHKRMHSERMKGKNNPFYGKKHTEETKNKIRNIRLTAIK